MNRHIGFIRPVFMRLSPMGVVMPTLSPGLVFAIVFTLIAVGFCIGVGYRIRKRKKMSAMQADFIDGLTHVLKTPIATIAVATDALRSAMVVTDSERVKHYVDIIERENHRMCEQVEWVLQLSRLEKGQVELNKEVIGLNKIVQESISQVDLIVKNRNGTIFDNLYKADLKVRVDPFHLRNAVVNILENANKYSPQSPDIVIRTFSANGFAHVSISDKGVGISKVEQKRIFSKFYRVPMGNVRDVGGQGLGLAYVKLIADRHGGSVAVQSEVGKGTVFTIKIPIS